MLTTNNNIDFKTATANLKNELKKMDLNLSHGAALNLLSRTLGYADYNTYKAIGTHNDLIPAKEDITATISETIVHNTISEDIHSFKSILQVCGMDAKESDISVQWMQQIPFTSKYKVFFKEISDIWSDGEDQVFGSFDEFIVFTLPVMVDYYIGPFTNRYTIYDTFYNLEEDEIIEMAMQKNLFLNPVICEKFFIKEEKISEEKVSKAYEYALLYFEDEVLSNDMHTPYLSSLIDIFERTQENGTVLDGYKDNNKRTFTSREFMESIESIEYQFKMKKSKKFIEFNPVIFSNDLGNDSWQIFFNPLFVKHFIAVI